MVCEAGRKSTDRKTGRPSGHSTWRMDDDSAGRLRRATSAWELRHLANTQTHGRWNGGEAV